MILFKKLNVFILTIIVLSLNYIIFFTPTNVGAKSNINFTITDKPTSNKTSVFDSFSKTVKFDKGKSSAIYSAELNFTVPEIHTYILDAKKGQFMTVSFLKMKGVEFSVVSPNGAKLASSTKSFSKKLPINGNYKVVMEGDGSERFASYKVNFKIN